MQVEEPTTRRQHAPITWQPSSARPDPGPQPEPRTSEAGSEQQRARAPKQPRARGGAGSGGRRAREGEQVEVRPNDHAPKRPRLLVEQGPDKGTSNGAAGPLPLPLSRAPYMTKHVKGNDHNTTSTAGKGVQPPRRRPQQSQPRPPARRAARPPAPATGPAPREPRHPPHTGPGTGPPAPGKSLKLLTTNIKSCHTIAELKAKLATSWNLMDGIHVSAALVQLRNLSRTSKDSSVEVLDLANQLCSAAEPLLPDCISRTLANILQAIACLPACLTLQPFVTRLLTHAEQLLPTCESQHLASMAWSLANLGHSCPGFMHTLLLAAQPLLHVFEPQELANTAWAMAKLGHGDPDFLDALISAAHPQLTNFGFPSLANMAWALAMLDHDAPRFLALT